MTAPTTPVSLRTARLTEEYDLKAWYEQRLEQQEEGKGPGVEECRRGIAAAEAEIARLRGEEAGA